MAEYCPYLCIKCAREMLITYEDFQWEPLPSVQVKNLEIRRCACGYYNRVYNKIAAFSEAVFNALLRKPADLYPREVVHLRTYVGLSRETLAKRMGIHVELMRDCEENRDWFSPTGRRLFRAWIAQERGIFLPPKLYEQLSLPANSVAIEIYYSFGDWQADYKSMEQPPDDGHE